MSLKAFSVTSDPNAPGARRLARSAAFWGWDHSFIIKEDQLDLNPPYKVWRPTYRAEQLGWCDAARKWEVDYLVYVDAWDTVFTGPPQELLLARGKISFGGDTVLYSDSLPRELGDLFPLVPDGAFRFVNCGTAWGDRQLFGELGADYLQHSPESLVNQDYFNWRYLYERGVGRSRLAVDSEARVALNVMLVQKRFFEMHGVRPYYIPTKSSPLILHVPGVGHTYEGKLIPLPAALEELYAE